jgi:hypothetical protein
VAATARDENSSPSKEVLWARLLASPDAARSRQMSVAGLLATMVGLIVSGIVFSASRPAKPIAILAICALTALALSVTLFAAAGLYASAEQFSEATLAQDVTTTLDRIACRARWGSRLAVLALVLALVVAALSLLQPTATTKVQVLLTVDGLKEATRICPDLQQPTVMVVSSSALASDEPLLRFTIEAPQCSEAQGSRAAPNVVLVVRRDQVAAMVEQDPA